MRDCVRGHDSGGLTDSARIRAFLFDSGFKRRETRRPIPQSERNALTGLNCSPDCSGRKPGRTYSVKIPLPVSVFRQATSHISAHQALLLYSKSVKNAIVCEKITFACQTKFQQTFPAFIVQYAHFILFAPLPGNRRYPHRRDTGGFVRFPLPPSPPADDTRYTRAASQYKKSRKIVKWIQNVHICAI